MQDNFNIQLPEEAKKQILEQIEHDSLFLAQNQINDYSLLIGVHNVTNSCPYNYENIKGGIYSKDRKKLYFIGIIDTLTEYG